MFLILLVVNFAVITKGSGRVSEVAARFTLDALPGKQLSIDADLAAGAINDSDAKARRSSLERETEFFGAMDGASKFVRGDAIAGLAITAINIIGGLLAGVIRDNLSLSQAAETYTLLTVGDGLISQMPALLVSTAAGIVVTRAGSGSGLGNQLFGQLFGSPNTLRSASAVLGIMAILPGLPFVPFGALSLTLYLLARRAIANAPLAKAVAKKAEAQKAPERIQDLLNVDTLELEVGYQLLSIIDLAKGGELPGRVTALRKQVATDLGILLPAVHLRDNLRLDPNEYRICIRGMEVGRGVAYLDRVMALDPSGNTPALEGIKAKEPAFGLPAVWIMAGQRANAESRGFTLVDPTSVITTHLSELLRRNAYELVGRQETQELLNQIGRESPKLVEDTVPSTVSLGDLVRVLRGLLREGISIRDLRTILEAVADAAPKSKDTVFLVEQARRRLQRHITSRVSDGTGHVHALTLDRRAEEVLRASLGSSDGEPTINPDIDTARALIGALETNAQGLTTQGHPAVLLAPADLRRPLFDFASRFIPDLWVVSARELVPGTSIEPKGTIQL